MNLKQCESGLEKLIGKGASVWISEKTGIYEIAQDSEELEDAINELDDHVFVKDIDENIDDYVVCFYGVDCDTRDYIGIIVIDGNKDVIAYGYTGD